MKVIGITGGIGSGKTTVCKIFSLLSIPIYNADAEAKKLYENTNIKKRIVKILGKEILNKDREIDKGILSEIIFNNPATLKMINSIIHPAVRKQFLKWKTKHKKERYVIKEAAIMIESGAIKEVDFLISITSSAKLRIERTLQRGNITQEQVLKRMKEQLSDKERNKFADAIIYNDDNHSLIEQVLTLHKKIEKTV